MTFNCAIENISNFKNANTANIFAINENNIFKVYSYDTLILEYNKDENKITYFNDEKYSSTTSKLQNALKRNFSQEIERYQNEKM